MDANATPANDSPADYCEICTVRIKSMKAGQIEFGDYEKWLVSPIPCPACEERCANAIREFARQHVVSRATAVLELISSGYAKEREVPTQPRSKPNSQFEPIGTQLDRLDNVIHALSMPMDDEFHLAQIRRLLPCIVADLKASIVECCKYNPWGIGDIAT